MSPVFPASAGLRLLPLVALLLAGGCAYDSSAQGFAPNYPPGYDDGMVGGQVVQPGDLFGGQNVQSIDVFLEPLAPHGQWVDSRYGRAFLPNAPQGWRPYVNGQWGENRLWISDDPWGWATDHYGRWGFDERIGAWVWVPGTEWAPSWVAWREADGNDTPVIGWAPVPPGVNYSFGVGFGSGFGGGFGYDNWNNWYQPSWVWVPSAYLYQPRFGGRVLPWSQGRNYWGGSRWNWDSGWNGRPGYGQWNGNYGRPGGSYGRPGGTYGRPGQPAIGGAIGGGIAGVPQRPRYGNNGGNWQGRPNNGGSWQGRPGQPTVGGAIGGGIAGVPQRPGYGGNWQGRQPDGGAVRSRPDGTQAGGNPRGGSRAGRSPATPPAGGYGGRPAYRGNDVGGAIAGGMVQRPAPQAQIRSPRTQGPAPQAQRAMPQVQPAPQAQRPASPQQSSGGRGRGESRYERPQ